MGPNWSQVIAKLSEHYVGQIATGAVLMRVAYLRGREAWIGGYIPFSGVARAERPIAYWVYFCVYPGLALFGLMLVVLGLLRTSV